MNTSGPAPDSEQASPIEEGDFVQVVYKYQDELYRYAKHLVLDKEEAFDVVQNTFLALHKNIDSLDRQKSLRPWLYKVARNLCLDFLKKRKALNFSELENGDEDSRFDIPARDRSLEELADSNLAEEKIRQALGQLPFPAREILVLKYFDDFTFEQIAGHLSLSVNTVKSHFYRSKPLVYQSLKNHGLSR